MGPDPVHAELTAGLKSAKIRGVTDAAPPTPSAPPPTCPDPGRRRLLTLATVGVGACAGASALGLPLVAVVGTALREAGAGDAGWVDAGPLQRFPDGKPVKVALEGDVRDGWQRLPRRTIGTVVVVRSGDAVRTLSATCPHNGCDVLVQQRPREASIILCPCHDSRFSLEGAVETGPSPRGLDPLEARVERGRVLVRFQRFEVGTAERRPV